MGSAVRLCLRASAAESGSGEVGHPGFFVVGYGASTDGTQFFMVS